MEYLNPRESDNESDFLTVYVDGEKIYCNSESVSNDNENSSVIIDGDKTVCTTGEEACVLTRNVNISGDCECNLINTVKLPCMYANQSEVSF